MLALLFSASFIRPQLWSIKMESKNLGHYSAILISKLWSIMHFTFPLQTNWSEHGWQADRLTWLTGPEPAIKLENSIFSNSTKLLLSVSQDFKQSKLFPETTYTVVRHCYNYRPQFTQCKLINSTGGLGVSYTSHKIATTQFLTNSTTATS